MEFILLWILVFCLHCCESIKEDDHAAEIERLTDCLSHIIRMLALRKVAFQYSEKSEDLLFHVLKKTEIPYVLNAVEVVKKEEEEERTPDDLVLTLEEVGTEHITNNTLWNAHTRFVMVSRNVTSLREYFETFWRFRLINVFAIVPKKKEIVLYSFLPYGPKNCTIEGPIEVDVWMKGAFRKKGFDLKDPTRLKDMNGCTIMITVNDAKPNLIFEGKGDQNLASDVEGFEGNLMKLMAKTLNYTPTFKLPSDGMNWGCVLPNAHGTVGEVYKGISEMAVGILGALPDRYLTLDISKEYNMQECVTFGIPQGMGAKNPAWLTIFIFDFTFFTWALIIFSFIMININMWVINRYSEVNWFNSKTELVLAVFSSCLGVPIKIPEFKSARTSIAFWIIFTFIITVAYKASLGSKLAVPPRDADIYTFKELVYTNLELIGLESMTQVMIPREDIVFQIMRRRFQPSNKTASYFVERIANNEMVAHLRHSTAFTYYSLLNPKARGRIHLLTDCLSRYYPLLILRRHSPFTNMANRIITRLEQGGIMDMWRSKYIYKIPTPQRPFHKLSNNQMYGVYLILILGHLVALSIFLWEIFSCNRHLGRKKLLFVKIVKKNRND